MKFVIPWVAVFGFLAISIFISACSDAKVAQSSHRGSETKTLGELAADVAIPIPREGKIVEFNATDDMVDPTWVAKILIPNEFLESMTISLQGKSADMGTYHNNLAIRTIWWHPKKAIFSTQYVVDRGNLVRAILSQDDGQIYLYIEHAVF